MMADSDDENLLYAPTGKDLHHQGKGLLGNGVKNVNDILNGPTDNCRLKKTIALCGAFLGLGLAIAVLGPTLEELQQHLNTDLPHVSYIFTGRSIGYVVGSIVGGITFERFHPLLLIALTLGMSGLGLLITPYCHHLMASVLAISFVGIAMGALDTGANIVCLRMWGKKSAPFMQALHFSFALGAFIAPLLAGPFIGLPDQCSNSSTPRISTSPVMTLNTSIPPKFINTTKPETTKNTNISTTAPTDLSSAELATSSEDEFSNSTSPEPETTKNTNISTTAPTDLSSTELATSSEDEFSNSTSPELTNSSAPASTDLSLTELVTFFEYIMLNSTSPAPTNSSTPAPTDSSETDTTSSSEEFSNSTSPAPTNSSTAVPRDSSETDTRRRKRESHWISRTLLEKFQRNDYTRFHAEEDVSKRKWVNKHWHSRIILGISTAVQNTVAASQSSVKTSVVMVTADPDSGKSSTAKHFQGVYVIIAVFLMLMGLVFTYFFCTSPLQHPQAGRHSEKVNMQNMKPSDKNFTNYILGLLFLFYFLYVGAEVGYGGFIYTFAINPDTVAFQPTRATHLNSLFWGTFALGRGLSICIASVISPFNMLLIDIAGCIVSSLALAYEANTNTLVLWVGTATLGASMASLFPAGISWLESHAPVTGNMASLLIVGAALGEMAIPLLLGNLFTSQIGPMSLMYVMLITSISTAIIFGITVYVATSEGKTYDPLPKEDVLEDIITGVQSAIDTTDVPFQLNGSTKQTSKPFLPKPLQVKKHKE